MNAGDADTRRGDANVAHALRRVRHEGAKRGEDGVGLLGLLIGRHQRAGDDRHDETLRRAARAKDSQALDGVCLSAAKVVVRDGEVGGEERNRALLVRREGAALELAHA